MTARGFYRGVALKLGFQLSDGAGRQLHMTAVEILQLTTWCSKGASGREDAESVGERGG